MNKTLLAPLVAVALSTLALVATRALAAPEHGANGAAAEHGKAGGEGASHGDPGGGSHGGADAGGHDAGPVVPADHKAVWPGIVLILILTMFVLAAVIGPIARMHAPPAEMPVTHSHDEPPGASHHHGASGTINPEPDHHGGAHGHGHH